MFLCCLAVVSSCDPFGSTPSVARWWCGFFVDLDIGIFRKDDYKQFDIGFGDLGVFPVEFIVLARPLHLYSRYAAYAGDPVLPSGF